LNRNNAKQRLAEGQSLRYVRGKFIGPLQGNFFAISLSACMDKSEIMTQIHFLNKAIPNPTNAPATNIPPPAIAAPLIASDSI
jgi:hypothetical protein